MARKKTSESENKENRNTPAEEQGDQKLPAEQQGGEPTRSRLSFRPRVDILETDKGLTLVADMPGAAPDSVEITLEHRELTIRAQVDEEEPENMTLLYGEYQVGDYERRFQLAGDFDVDRIEAKLTNGVLHLTVPRAPEPEAKRIKVKAS